MHCYEGDRGHRCFKHIGKFTLDIASWQCMKTGGRLPLPKNADENESLRSIGMTASSLRLLDLSGPAQDLTDSYGNRPSFTNWSNAPNLDDTTNYVFMDSDGKWSAQNLASKYVDVVCEVIIGKVVQSQV